jgi:hypothetical protein
VVNGVDSLPKDRSDLVVCVHACGKKIACPAKRQRGRIHQTTRQLESGNHVLYVVRMVKKIRIDRRMRSRYTYANENIRALPMWKELVERSGIKID